MTITVRGLELPVDIKAEIEHYEWEQPKWTAGRLIACSPFRDERNPSFAVNLENGTFIDSGGDGEWRKGNFVKLLSFINSEPYEDTETRLISLYSPQYAELEELKLPDVSNWVSEEESKKTFDSADLKPYAYKHPYLERRGIPFNVQRAFDVGYDPETESVVIPWHNRKGEIVSWKHRKVNSKKFWYVKGGQPIRNHLYGIHWVTKRGFTEVWIVESEIDALTLWSKGIPAVAIGGSVLNNAKRDILLRSGIETIVIATDNDKDGRKGRRIIIEQMTGLVNLREMSWEGVNAKDINDIRDIVETVTILEVNVLGDWNVSEI